MKRAAHAKARKRTNLFILAAGDIRHKFHYLRSQCACPALMPVHTKPLVLYLLEFYERFPDLAVRLAVDESQVGSVKNELLSFGGRVSVHGLPKNDGVVESLAQMLREVPETEACVVNVVTTIPAALPSLNEVLLSEEREFSKDWSSVSFGKGGAASFHSKNEPGEGRGCAFTGVFSAKSGLLKKALKKAERANDLIYAVKSLAKLCRLSYRRVEWLDCGHEANYYAARAKLVCSRSFNSLEVTGRGTIIKRSEDTAKLRQESLYVQMLPPELRHFYPRLIDAGLDGGGSYEMEYYGYPNVSELMLYWDVKEGLWLRMFKSLEELLRYFKEYSFSIGYQAHYDFYQRKFDERVARFRRQLKERCEDSLLDGELFVNGLRCLPLSKLESRLAAKFKSLYDERDFCVVHGDFCFNNILYDMPSGVAKLIDPRGSFGDSCRGIYGDQKYDLAKLAHSSAGFYDYLVNGAFMLNFSGKDAELSFNLRDNHRCIGRATASLVEGMGYRMDDILFLVGTLFVTMCPLHSDSAVRQKAMYLHGLRMLNEALA